MNDFLIDTGKFLVAAILFGYGVTLLFDWLCSPYADGKIRGGK